MAITAGIGHNRGRGGRIYAIVVDFDIDMLQQHYPNASWNNAYTDVRNYLSARGFEWTQGSVYFSNETVDAVSCVLIVQRFAKKYPWFAPSVRDIRMLRIEENSDLKTALMEGLSADESETNVVMRGLDPRIHPSSLDDGLPGQARQ
jgi:virulence-associated protein VapD